LTGLSGPLEESLSDLAELVCFEMADYDAGVEREPQRGDLSQ
jgi:hypothetical protein